MDDSCTHDSIGTALIESLVHACTAAFSEAMKHISTKEARSQSYWRDVEGRFALWQDGFSAGEGWLDRMLSQRGEREIRESVVLLLCSLVETLGIPITLKTTVLSIIEKAKKEIPEIRSTLDDAKLEETITPEELEAALEDVVDTVDSLFNLTPFLEEIVSISTSASDSSLSSAAHPIDTTSTSGAAAGVQWYRSNILDNFPSISTQLAEALASVNWARRERVRDWREQHIAALQQDEQEYDEEDEDYEHLEDYSELSSCDCSTASEGSSFMSTLSSVFSRRDRGHKNCDEMSISTYQSSISVGGQGKAGPSRARWPEPPCALEPGMEPFECSICFQRIHVENIAQWRKHVLRDLSPYSCIYPSCTSVQQTYNSRRDWVAHEFTSHRFVSDYVCMPSCGRVFSNRDDMSSHILRMHLKGMGATTSEISDLVSSRERRKPPTTRTAPCPFCGDLMEQTRNAVRRHVGDHMEQIALKTLPPELFEAKAGSDGEERDSEEEEVEREREEEREWEDEVKELAEGLGAIKTEASNHSYFAEFGQEPLIVDNTPQHRRASQSGSHDESSIASPKRKTQYSPRSYSEVIRPFSPGDLGYGPSWPPLPRTNSIRSFASLNSAYSNPLRPSSSTSSRASQSPSPGLKPSPSFQRDYSQDLLEPPEEPEKYVGKSMRDGDRKGSRESRQHGKDREKEKEKDGSRSPRGLEERRDWIRTPSRRKRRDLEVGEEELSHL